MPEEFKEGSVDHRGIFLDREKKERFEDLSGKSYIENLRNFISIGSDRVINGYRLILCEKKKKRKERNRMKSKVLKLANFKIGDGRIVDEIVQKNCII